MSQIFTPVVNTVPNITKIVLAITGGIAAYKSALLARLLVKEGFEVRVIMTQGAQQFITPLTLQALTGNEVHTELLDTHAELGMGHIELAKWADLVLIAPASANTLARLAMGMADDLLATVCLATTAPVMVAPAMNQQMWAHPAVQLNVQTLSDMGYEMVEPDSGVQACGDVGAGRLPEPEILLRRLLNFKAKLMVPQSLVGKKVTITAGPTVEAIDPVRFLSNHSTGKMGFALARACRDAGAEVTLIAGGKVDLTTPLDVQRVNVLSANDMLQAANQSAAAGCDIFIATAAVADYRTRDAAPQKIKKTQDEMTLDLVKNPDILATISHTYPDMFMVGFAAETQNLLANAQHKLASKSLDLLAANDVSRTDIGFNSDENQVTFIQANGVSDQTPKTSKRQIATALVERLADILKTK